MSRICATVAVSVWGLLALALGGPSERFTPDERPERTTHTILAVAQR